MTTKRQIFALGLAGVLGTGLMLPGLAAADRDDRGRDYRDHHRYEHRDHRHWHDRHDHKRYWKNRDRYYSYYRPHYDKTGRYYRDDYWGYWVLPGRR